MMINPPVKPNETFMQRKGTYMAIEAIGVICQTALGEQRSRNTRLLQNSLIPAGDKCGLSLFVVGSLASVL